MKASDTYLHRITQWRKPDDPHGLAVGKAEFSQSLGNAVRARDGVNTALLFRAEVGKCFHIQQWGLSFSWPRFPLLDEIDNQFQLYKQAPLQYNSAPMRHPGEPP